MRCAILLGLVPTLLGFAGVEAAPLKAVVFDLEIVAASPLERDDSTQAARAKKASEAMRHLLAGSSQVTLVDSAPAAAEIAKKLPLSACRGCDLDIARRLGADVEIATALQRSSPVILGFSGAVRDVRTGKLLRSAVVDIRGDTDEDWARGLRFLLRDRLLDPPLPDGTAALRALVDRGPAGQE